ncbi:MAG TPA: hypothetical protein VLX28_09555 [Thermoanaerobaculia bacterium]|nr:hypothetical protein [Thermoanaerobaculia bacterium]
MNDIRFLLKLPGVDRVTKLRVTSIGRAWETASMKSSEPSDPFDLAWNVPTTPEDIEALRNNRPRLGENWWEQLQMQSISFLESKRGVAKGRRSRAVSRSSFDSQKRA